ncbi:MAG: sulfate adenylyltransferase subunit CysN [Bacteroidales bacterium]
MEQKLNIKEFLDKDEQKDLLRLLTAGSVDDGKSTLIGRLLFDSKKLYEDQLDALERDSKRVGNAGAGEIDYALLLDGLKAEREQGITIDVAYRYFSTNRRKFIIADTPGHEQYTRNMITGGSTANLAIILVDARTGVITQTKRHTFLVSLLGIKHVVLAVNKMDLVNYDEAVFNQIVEDYKSFVTRLDIPDIKPIPISALKGDNVVESTDAMPWYKGETLLEFLETVHIGSDHNYEDFRYPVQYVLRPNLDFRGFSAKVSSGIVKKGDEIMALPSGKRSKVKGIHTYEGEIDQAFPPMAVTLTLEDEIDISRGEMIVHPDNQPSIDRHFEAMLVWMDEEAMDPRKQFYIKHTTNMTKARIDEIRYKVDVNTLEQSKIDRLSLNEIGRVVLTTNKPLLFDSYKKNKSTGSFILIDPITNNTSAVGMIIEKLNNKDLPSRINDMNRELAQEGKSLISSKEREDRFGQKGQTLWITGLAGSGKRELAYILERRLFDEGKTAVVLDGSSVRAGLSHELDFTPSDRAEHLRRVAHMSRLLNNQGIITICAFRSPDNAIREQVKDIIGAERFTLIYMDESLEDCKKRDAQMYAEAEDGRINDVPGIDTRYDEPQDADYNIKLSEIEMIEDLIRRI